LCVVVVAAAAAAVVVMMISPRQVYLPEIESAAANRQYPDKQGLV
jgi:hypothetical protein